MSSSRLRNGIARLLKLAVALAVVVAAAGIVLSQAFAWFAVLAGVGGTVIALFFMWSSRRHAPPAAVPDSFSRDAFSTDTVNVAHVRVAGVGGLGLVLVALAVAADFPLATAVVSLGLAGGVIAAVIVILRRRDRGPLPSGTDGPGARAVLFVESPPPADDRAPDAADASRRHAVPASV